jgi:MFS superfamily sulfate permease-like transporter
MKGIVFNMELTGYIKPELLVLIPVLFLVGLLVKAATESNKWVPLTLGITGVVLSILWVLATSVANTIQDVTMAVFTGIVQGVLCAGAAACGNQLVKRDGKPGGDIEEEGDAATLEDDTGALVDDYLKSLDVEDTGDD